MARTFTAAGIIRYDDKHGRCGKLLGLITFTDGKSLKVWDAALHKQCRQLAAFPPHEVRYEFRHSAKWGDALEKIESSKTDWELADMARAADEERGRVAANSFLGQRIGKRNQAIAPEAPTPASEISQVNALPPGQVDNDHESLMRREG